VGERRAQSEIPVAVVGAGPCGLAAAVALKREGIPHVVFDKAGVVSSIESYPTNLVFFSTPEKLVIGGVPFACAGERPTRREGIEYYRLVRDVHGIVVREHERVTRVERVGAGFVLHAEPADGVARTTDARAVVIATGYFDYPNMLGVPGETLPHVSHRFVDGASAADRDVLVVGGGNSAVECAMELARCGARVTLVHYETGFVSHVIKPWILPEFDRQLAAGAIRLRWCTRVTGIEPSVAHMNTAGEATTIPADLVYLMTGYTPRPGLLGDLGVAFDPATGIPEHDPATMETPVRGVFVAGVLTSGLKANGVFIENGRGHGALIAAALAVREASGG
jgi:thioredoxin reductase (NADPH)